MSENQPFYQQLKVINKIYKPNTAAYLMLLIDSHKYWAAHPDKFYKLTNKRFTGRFYISRSSIENQISIKRSTQKKAEEELLADGIISITPIKGEANWFKIDNIMLQEKIENYNWEQENLKEAKIDYPFDESEEYEEWIFGDVCEKEAHQDIIIEQGRPSKSDAPPRKKVTANKNKDIIIKNKNKVSNATYVSDETKALNNELDCIENNNFSCIKDNDSKIPPPKSSDDEIMDIINEYNTAMGIKYSDKDYFAVKNNLDDFKSIRKYLTPECLAYAWNNFSDTTAKNVEMKRISAFVKYKVLSPFVKRKDELYSYFADTWDNKLNKVFKIFKNNIDEILEAENLRVNLIGEIEYEDGDTLFGKYHRRKRIEIYKQFIEPKLLQKEDLHDMIIDMEVPEWII